MHYVTSHSYRNNLNRSIQRSIIFCFIDHALVNRQKIFPPYISHSIKKNDYQKKKPPWILEKNLLNFPHLDSWNPLRETPFEISRTISLARAIPPGTFHSRDASKWINSRRQSTSLSYVRISRSDRFCGQVTSACAHEEDPPKRVAKRTRVGQRSSFARSSSMVQGRNARGVGYCAALCLFLVTGGYPSPPSFWSNICPRKNKSLLSLTTGRASLVSNRALFNRRRITDPESIQAPFSFSLSLSLPCSPVSSPEPSLLLVVFLSRVSLVVPVPLALWVCPPLKVWDRDNCSIYIEYLWINSSVACSRIFFFFFSFFFPCSCSFSFEAVFLFLNPYF